jgi:hypothetical protein
MRVHVHVRHARCYFIPWPTTFHCSATLAADTTCDLQLSYSINSNGCSERIFLLFFQSMNKNSNIVYILQKFRSKKFQFHWNLHNLVLAWNINDQKTNGRPSATIKQPLRLISCSTYCFFLVLSHFIPWPFDQPLWLISCSTCCTLLALSHFFSWFIAFHY